jgi:ribosome-associated protein
LSTNKKNQSLIPLEVAQQVVEAASNKQAENIVILDARNVCSFADYFVICSAGSDRQIDAIQEEIATVLHDDIKPVHISGKADSGWVLIDLGTVIVHIFSMKQRNYYMLDELWNEAKTVVRIQ